MLFRIDPDISVAHTLIKDFYLDEAVFIACKEKIFARSWHYAGNITELSSPHDCHPFTLMPGYLEEPLLLTRDASGDIHCLSNVCTHRGNIIVDKNCNQPHLRCRYHGRLFQLNGKFRSMPEFKEVKDFPTEMDSLRNLPVHQLGELLFTSIAPVHEFQVFFEDMLKRISWLPLDEFSLRPELSETFEVNANWALYCENYLEGFHIPFVHAGLNAVIDFRSYTTELFDYSSLQLGLAKDEDMCFDIPPSSQDHDKQVAAYYFFIFPNLMFNFYPWGLSVNIIEPMTPDKTRVRFLNYVWKEQLRHKGAGASLHTVEMEDEEVVEAVQRGIRSRFYKHGRYSVTQETGTHHFHRLISKFME